MIALYNVQEGWWGRTELSEGRKRLYITGGIDIKVSGCCSVAATEQHWAERYINKDTVSRIGSFSTPVIQLIFVVCQMF